MLFALKIIDGVRKRVAQIRYSNGTTVERVYPMDSDIPEDVRVVEPSQDVKNTEAYNPHVRDHIVNQEYLMYEHYHKTQMGLWHRARAATLGHNRESLNRLFSLYICPTPFII